MTSERTIAFVDLAGFTALTETHGDQAAVDLLDTFTGITAAAIQDTGTELVKTIGDAVMLAADTPDAAVGAVQRLFEAAYDRDGFPEPRAGLHHGPVIARDGDFFGATVNLAARVASRAGSGQALATGTVLDAAHKAGLDTVSLGMHQLRNIFEPVELWAVELCPTHIDLSVDPVCRMRLACQAAVGRVRHDGIEYRFCSLPCTAAFAADPDRYADGGAS
jgi:class 3 adenylate cyclase/YHS domain-containing protein